MPRLTDSALREKALEICKENMSQMVRTELRIEPGVSSTEWDPFLQRHIFEQIFTAWRDFDEVEMLVSPAGQILSFRDNNRFILSGPPPTEPLAPADLLQIAGTTGLVSEEADLQSMEPMPEGMLTVTFRQEEPGYPPGLVCTINPNTRQVAAFKVEEQTHP